MINHSIILEQTNFLKDLKELSFILMVSLVSLGISVSYIIINHTLYPHYSNTPKTAVSFKERKRREI